MIDCTIIKKLVRGLTVANVVSNASYARLSPSVTLCLEECLKCIIERLCSNASLPTLVFTVPPGLIPVKGLFKIAGQFLNSCVSYVPRRWFLKLASEGG